MNSPVMYKVQKTSATPLIDQIIDMASMLI